MDFGMSSWESALLCSFCVGWFWSIRFHGLGSPYVPALSPRPPACVYYIFAWLENLSLKKDQGSHKVFNSHTPPSLHICATCIALLQRLSSSSSPLLHRAPFLPKFVSMSKGVLEIPNFLLPYAMFSHLNCKYRWNFSIFSLLIFSCFDSFFVDIQIFKEKLGRSI